tara:strand:+ start:162 stop:473 length:312 start_codon:yes stop_codon:yes gene_type:complete
MSRKLLAIVNFLIFGSLLVIPFYTEYSFIKILLPYLSSLVWFGLIILMGANTLVSIFMGIVYFLVAAIFFSYGFDYGIIISMVVGIVGAILVYFSSGMDLNED